jgi:hypothetical protein
VARILIVGGGCRGRRLAGQLVGEGHAVRVTSRGGAREAIEAAGAECWPGDPNRLATLRGALDGVTILAWLLATASGPREQLRELHTARLEFFLTQAIDTTVRGFVFEAAGTAPALQEGEAIARELTARNAIPLEVVSADPADQDAWLPAARAAIASLLG